MSYLERLKEDALSKKSILCLGLDPEPDRIPLHGNENEKKIKRFCYEIIDATQDDISMVKPNYAFFEQNGYDGFRALRKVIHFAQSRGLIVNLDVKRNDVAHTMKAHAKAVFDLWGADACTVNPFFGFESIEPFMEYKDKGIYVLVRTSNPGAKEFQDSIYRNIAHSLARNYQDGLGAVVGATYPEELEEVLGIFASYLVEVPLLIPGIGTQGGDLETVLATIKENYPLIHRINATSSIIYSWEKTGLPFAESAKQETERIKKAMQPLF